jgi:hypothetical protein
MARIPNEKKVLILLVLAIFAAIQLPNVLVLGKNADGVEYAAVARNLAEGYGSFFKPYLSDYQFSVHYEQPPLFYGIQSLFFRVLGDTDYMEGIYGVLVALLVLALVAGLWRDLGRSLRTDPDLPGPGAWWPILLLLAVSQFLYNVQTNRILMTFLVFALLSVGFAMRSVTRERGLVFHAVLAGVAVFLGFETKGPFALFAVVVPGLAWLTLGVPLRRALLATGIVIAVAAGVFFATLWIWPDARTLWTDLLEKQVVASVEGKREAHRSVFYNVSQFAQQMAGPLGLLLVLSLVTRTSPRRFRFPKTALFLLLVALAGSLPLFVLPRQKVRYMLHAFPFFLMALAVAAAPVAARIESCVRERRRAAGGLTVLSVVLILGGLTAMVVREGRVTKAHAFFEDVYLQDLGIPPRSTVTVKPRRLIWKENLFQYPQRHMKVSVTWREWHEYLIVDKDFDEPIPEGYVRINREPTLRYHVYRR